MLGYKYTIYIKTSLDSLDLTKKKVSLIISLNVNITSYEFLNIDKYIKNKKYVLKL